jgi:cation:H+ antiporter
VLIWAAFILCTAAIVYSGIRLSRYGDILAEKLGLGKAWFGMVLIASVTSLPELVTGISSVTVVGVPDIAVGDIMGSCVFNMLIIAFLDALYRPMPISTKAQQGNILSAGFGILLISLAGINLLTGGMIPPFGWVGYYSLLFMVIYLIGMKSAFSYAKRAIAAYVKGMAEECKYTEITTRDALLNYCLNAAVVVVAATFLPWIGKGIAESTGLGQTFVGNTFIALSTSLPEVVVSIAAVRIDAVDMAIGNLFGSNIFNILILAIDDFFFVKGPLLSHVSQGHVVPALSAIAMTTVAIIGLIYHSERKRIFLAWDSVGIVLIYVMNILLLYMLR